MYAFHFIYCTSEMYTGSRAFIVNRKFHNRSSVYVRRIIIQIDLHGIKTMIIIQDGLNIYLFTEKFSIAYFSLPRIKEGV